MWYRVLLTSWPTHLHLPVITIQFKPETETNAKNIIDDNNKSLGNNGENSTSDRNPSAQPLFANSMTIAKNMVDNQPPNTNNGNQNNTSQHNSNSSPITKEKQQMSQYSDSDDNRDTNHTTVNTSSNNPNTSSSNLNTFTQYSDKSQQQVSNATSDESVDNDNNNDSNSDDVYASTDFLKNFMEKNINYTDRLKEHLSTCSTCSDKNRQNIVNVLNHLNNYKNINDSTVKLILTNLFNNAKSICVMIDNVYGSDLDSNYSKLFYTLENYNTINKYDEKYNTVIASLIKDTHNNKTKRDTLMHNLNHKNKLVISSVISLLEKYVSACNTDTRFFIYKNKMSDEECNIKKKDIYEYIKNKLSIESLLRLG
jgi:hypothetical protein